MLTEFGHYTDAELLLFVGNNTGHLAAEGELVRRVVAEEWRADVRDEQVRVAEEERDEAQTCADAADAKVDELQQKLAKIAELVA